MNKSNIKRVTCLKQGCSKSWWRHPALEVACPSCHANVGSRCKRPSGHSCNFHKDRRVAAEAQGFYGTCPLNCCIEDPIRLAKAQRAFDEANKGPTDQLQLNL